MDMIKEEPWLETRFTKIWRLPIPTEDMGQAIIGYWLIYAPWVHLAWDYHLAVLVHLRPLEGFPPANFQFDGATHEFGVYALDPRYQIEALEGPFTVLSPISIAEQFIQSSDAAALAKIENLFDAVLHKQLSVDSDYRRTWEKMLRG